MPDDALMSASLAYRKNEAAIIRGDVPEKYLRLLAYIPGERILEIGSAEGVLACLLAKAGKLVTALERRQERHEAAQQLRDAWGLDVNGPRFVWGDAAKNLSLLEGKDTLVAVRMIYYLGKDLDMVFAEAAKHVRNVVLCGNANRARWWREGLPNRNDRADNYYASADGMKDVLIRHGFEIATEVLEGDPIVVGRRNPD
jgi:2-polyprenyl-3-methyl-5-hydroxy-6-metoxy-1,4-benzoquinol methylase